MTARKNQAQPIILKTVLFIGPFRRTRLRFEISHELALRLIESCPSPQSINGFESGRRNQPWSRVAGYSTARPHAQRSRKGFVHRLLGKIKVTEQADQSCQDSSRIHAIKGVEQFADLLMYRLGGTLGHDDDRSKPATRNQFGNRRIDVGQRRSRTSKSSERKAALKNSVTPIRSRTRIAATLTAAI